MIKFQSPTDYKDASKTMVQVINMKVNKEDRDFVQSYHIK